MPVYLRQSTASQEVPLGHFVDSTDGVTAETGLTIANTDIKVWKTGATTLANKNSGGATHISGGIYYAVLDATDTDTIGPLVLFVAVSGALAVRLECVVLDEAVYDVLFGTTALSTLGGTAQTGDCFARLGAPAGASVSADVAAVKSQTAAIETDTQDIQARLPAALGANGNIKADVRDYNGTAGTFSGGRPEVNASHWGGTAVGSAAVRANLIQILGTAPTEGGAGRLAGAFTTFFDVGSPVLTTASVNQAGDAYAIVNSGTHGNAALKTLIDTVDGVVDAILLDTGTDGVVVAAGSKAGYSLAATGLDSISAADPGGVASTFPQMLVQLWRRFFKKSTLTSTQLLTYADNGSTVRTTQTVSDDGTTQTQGAAS